MDSKRVYPASLLDEQFELEGASRPTSPWSFFNPSRILPRRLSTVSGHSGSDGYTFSSPITVTSGSGSLRSSRIPVLSDSIRYPSYRFYSDIPRGESSTLVDDNDDPDPSTLLPSRFSDPPPTVKELHAAATSADTQGKERFPPHHGISEDSKVWTEYVNETTAHDHELISGLDGSLDVLLIFVRVAILMNHAKAPLTLKFCHRLVCSALSLQVRNNTAREESMLLIS